MIDTKVVDITMYSKDKDRTKGFRVETLYINNFIPIKFLIEHSYITSRTFQHNQL